MFYSNTFFKNPFFSILKFKIMFLYLGFVNIYFSIDNLLFQISL